MPTMIISPMQQSPAQQDYVTKGEFKKFELDTGKRLDRVDERLDRVDKRFDNVDERFDDLNSKVDVLRGDFNEFRQETGANFTKQKEFMDQGFDKMEELINNSLTEFGGKLDKSISTKIKQSEDRVIAHINSKFVNK